MPGIDNCQHAGECRCGCVACTYYDAAAELSHCRQHPNGCHLPCNATRPVTTERDVAQGLDSVSHFAS